MTTDRKAAAVTLSLLAEAPRLKAEHMAAPTNPANVKNALPARSRPHMALSGRPVDPDGCLLLGRADMSGPAATFDSEPSGSRS
jgi:hypothetical protein